MFVSYAQNFEDVVLWRALRHVEHGFYIDIGAQDPVVDSISLAFYEMGWRGVHVEPAPAYALALRLARPDEVVLEVAVGEGDRLISLHEIPNTGLSTGDAQVAESHARAGFSSRESDVASVSLAALLDRYGDREIHWLKIDVEGMETSALRSWGLSKARPWVVVVEATVPLARETTHETWEHLLVERGYRFVYWDGLNRFYVAETHPELQAEFSAPPNVFDAFALSGTGSHHFTAKLKEDIAHLHREAEAFQSRHAALQSQLEQAMREARASSEAAPQLLAAKENCGRLENDLATERHALAAQRDAHDAESATLRDDLARLDVELAAARSAQSELNARISDIESGHARHLADVRRLYEERLAERDQGLRRLDERFAESKADLQRREAHLIEQLESLQEEMRERQAGFEEARARSETMLGRTTHDWQQRQDLVSAERDTALGTARVVEAALAVTTERLRGVEQERDSIRERVDKLVAELSATTERGRVATAQSESALSTARIELAARRAAWQADRAMSEATIAALRQGLSEARSGALGRIRSALRRGFQTSGVPVPQPHFGSEPLGRPFLATGDPAIANGDLAPLAMPQPGIPSMPPIVSPHSAPSTEPRLVDLLRPDGSAFLERAYLSLLKRPADPDGLAFWGERMKAGVPKRAVLKQLLDSPESLQRGIDLPDLRKALGSVKTSKERPDNLAGARCTELTTLAELLARDGIDFVDGAYRAILRRDADAEGRRFYSASLAEGVAKIDILEQLYRSSEREEVGTTIRELEHAIRAYRLTRIPLIGALFRRRGVEGTRLGDVRLRRVEQAVLRLKDELSSHVTQVRRESTRNGPLIEEIQQSLKRTGTLGERARGSAMSALSSSTSTSSAGIIKIRHTDLIPANGAQRRVPMIYFFVDHTVRCPVNTGMQRVVRRLSRALLEIGESVTFVKWNAEQERLSLASRADLAHLAQWNGPQLTPDQLASYPLGGIDDDAVAIDPSSQGAWLLVPEVTHITYQAAPITLDVQLAARRIGLQTAFIYYDAVPLRLAAYRETAEKHETYMQQLLFSDQIAPISNRSADELREFLRVHQSNRALNPVVEALSLPAESQLSPRSYHDRTKPHGSTTILSVGSIEPRKNQLVLLEAFQRLCARHPESSWRLVLAGHLRGDVAAQVMSYIEGNPRIEHVQSISDPDLDALYRSSAFTVFPSVEEGFGLPILESLWYAKPCLCANFGAMAEVAEGGGCFVVDTRSVDAVDSALERLIGDESLRNRLAEEASRRPLATWHDYATRFAERLAVANAIAPRLGTVYYWVDNTCVNPSNSGIQRVTRQLAKALLGLGVDVVPVRWVGQRGAVALSSSELEHLARWDGPSPAAWSPWRMPDRSNPSARGWLLIPELTHDDLNAVRSYAAVHGLQTAAVFYDTIPYKLRGDYGREFGGNHRRYMEQVLSFDKIFPISRYSGLDLLGFYLHSDFRSMGLDTRVVAIPLADEFAAGRRVASLPAPSDCVRILSVISIEPRKNPLTLLAAFEAATKRMSSRLVLTIIGRRIPAFEGLARQVEARVATLPGVTWEQDVDDARLAALMSECDFTVFPSLEEGFGLPILESLWSGRPCICHDSGAMLEVAAGGGCVLADMRNIDAIADAIVRLASDHGLRVSLADDAAERPVRTWRDYANDIGRQLVEHGTGEQLASSLTVAEEERFYSGLVNVSRRPTLSICISTYNRSPWLSVALRNLARLVPAPSSDIEIIVCDNCSTDDTPLVVAPYRSRSDFRSYRNPHNVGMLGNLRVTANHAHGKYIWILGDDDLPFAGSIEKVLAAIAANPEAALVYLNYSYTRETDAASVTDIDEFLASGTPVVADSPNQVAAIKELAILNENLFTAIYCLVFRRDHALRAYSQDTSGRPFSTMRTSIPTTYHVLSHMMEEEGVWIGSPQLLVNFNVSWNDYAALQILERVPEALDLAELKGSPSSGVDRWRSNLLPGYVHYFKDIYGEDAKMNSRHFSAARVISRVKHLEGYRNIAAELSAIYREAYARGHHAAQIDPEIIFGTS